MNEPSAFACQTNNGETLAAKLVGEIFQSVNDLNLPLQEQTCRQALEVNGVWSAYASSNKASKRADKKPVDIFSKLNTFTTNQIKNQNNRFFLDESETRDMIPSRQSWGFKGFSMNNVQESKEYEDVLNKEILEAPISDICIVQSSEQIPPDFYRHYKTPGNRKANINTGTGGNPLYLCIKKDLTGKFPPVTNIQLFSPDRGENLPAGYFIVQKGNIACNLNAGTSSERLYLCYKRDFLSNPLVDIQIIFPSKHESIPRNFFLLEKTISGQAANLNLGTNGLEIFFTYRQALVRLHCLTNEYDVSRGSRRSVSLDINTIPSMQTRARSQSRSPMRERVSSLDLPHHNTHPPSLLRPTEPSNNATDNKLMPLQNHEALSHINNIASDNNNAHHSLDPVMASIPEDVEDPVTEENDQMTGIGVEFDDDLLLEEDASEEALLLYEEVKDYELVNLRKHQCVVTSVGGTVSARSRRALYALLSALYIRQGNVAEQVVQGLHTLLKDTNFYEQDLLSLPLPNTVTMLDITIESVCDRFDLGTEAEHPVLLNFLKTAIKHSGARLSSVSLQRMFRAIMFLCNLQSAKPNWMADNLSMPCNDFGQEMTPYRIMKTLIWDIVSQVETVDVAPCLPEYENSTTSEDPYSAKGWLTESERALCDFISTNNTTTNSNNNNNNNNSVTYQDVRGIVMDFVDDIIDSVEISRHCEHVLLFISKQSVSISSNVFWQQSNQFGKKFFAESPLRSAYAILCAICKLAWNGIRLTKQNEYNARELGLKLIALESIQEFLSCAGEKMRLSKVMGYQIRRLIVPCLLFNISYALVDHRIFAKLMKVITALWKVWRRHVRIEFAILCEQLIFKVLQASVLQIRPIFQMIVIQEIVNWFDQPYILIEMFVNYDLDRKFVSHWNTFSYVVRSICAIGRRLTLVTGAWAWKHNSIGLNEEKEKIAVTFRDVHLEALEEVARIAKTLMDASGHAYLMQQDKGFRDRSLGESAGWIEDDEVSAAEGPSNPRNSRPGSIRLRRAAHQESESLIQKAIDIYTSKNSLKKAIDFLITKGFMPDTPQEITNFLRVYKNSFDPVAIGEFLGEGGVNPIEEDYWSQIRFRYTRAISFAEMHLEPALRLYLTNGGFRLPGEAQKINRFVEVFVKTFWQDNKNTAFCTFQHPDTLHLLSYAIIMLNTDLHRAAHQEAKNKKHKKMTKEEFANNLRGIDQGQDVPRDYLYTIYDTIAQNPLELTVKSSNTANDDLLPDMKTMSNDILAGVLRNPHTPNAHPALASTNGTVSNELRIVEERKFIREVCTTTRDSEDLLRSLSVFTHRFSCTNIDVKISLNLVSFMYETVWFHFHAIIESILQTDDTEISIKFLALDILCYSLTSAIFLDLKQERLTFALLLQKFRSYCESLPHYSVASTNGSGASSPTDGTPAKVQTSSISTGVIKKIPDDSWYYDITGFSPTSSSPEVKLPEADVNPPPPPTPRSKAKLSSNRLEIAGKLHHLIVHIKDIIQESTTYELTRKIAAKFEKKAKVMEKNSFFVKSGELLKLNRTGRSIAYHFFLFSNYLYYTHYTTMKKEYIVHEELSLNALSVSDLDTDPTYCSFYISHPIKSFVVICPSPQDKQQWLREINQTIASCHKREIVAINGVINRRMSIVSRLETQQSVQRQESEHLRHTAPSTPVPPIMSLPSNDISDAAATSPALPSQELFLDEEGSDKFSHDEQTVEANECPPYQPESIMEEIIFQSAPFQHMLHTVKTPSAKVVLPENIEVVTALDSISLGNSHSSSNRHAEGNNPITPLSSRRRPGSLYNLHSPPCTAQKSTDHDVNEEFLQINLDLVSDEDEEDHHVVNIVDYADENSEENSANAADRVVRQQEAVQSFHQLMQTIDDEALTRLFVAVSNTSFPLY